MSTARTYRLRLGISAVVLGLLLSGCTGADSGSGPTTPAASPEETSMAEVALTTADSTLGTIIVDAKGITVYVFDNDTPNSGTSVCEGECLVKWPAVVADSDAPTAEGVTGTLGTITRTDDGTRQITLNGLPLYYWVDDTAAGDVSGQGVGGVWWVVAPDGTKITDGS